MTTTPTNTALTDAAAEAADAEVKPAKAKAKTSAMIASIAEAGQKTVSRMPARAA